MGSGLNFYPQNISVEITVPQMDALFMYKEIITLQDDGKGNDLMADDGYFTATIQPYNCGEI